MFNSEIPLIDNIQVIDTDDIILFDAFEDVKKEIDKVVFNKNYRRDIKNKCKKLYEVIEG